MPVFCKIDRLLIVVFEDETRSGCRRARACRGQILDRFFISATVTTRVEIDDQ
jgi:hypothetical protein